MPKSIFYSAITGQPLENPVVFDGYLCDLSEAEKILNSHKPTLISDKRIVEGGNGIPLDWIQNSLKKYGKPIPANFLQPVIDAAYSQSAWPRPSALNQYHVVMNDQASAQLIKTDVVASALRSLFGDSLKIVNDNLSMDVSITKQNKRYAEVLNKYGVITKPVVHADHISISGLNLQTLIIQAEHARIMMLNMRRVLMSKPANLTSTDEVKLQHKIINGLNVLDKPLVSNSVIQQTASIQDALALLNAFSKVQDIATTRIYPGLFGKDSAHAWHMLIAEDESFDSVQKHIKPFKDAYTAQIEKFESYSSAEDLIKLGEYARMTLLRLKPLSEKQEEMGFNYTTGHDWSDELKAQRALVDSLGSQAEGQDIDESIQARLSESLLNRNLPEAARLERAKIYVDTLSAIHAVSAAVVNDSSLFHRSPRAGEKAWHEMIAEPKAEMDIAKMFARVESKATGNYVVVPNLQEIDITNPFDDYLTRNPDAAKKLNICSLNGQPTKVPVIFLDGYVYDGNALHAYLSAGNSTSPVTGEDFKAVISNWNLNNLSNLLPVSTALLQADNEAQLQGNNYGFILAASAPPAEDFITKKPEAPAVYPTINNNNNNAKKVNELPALQGLIPMEARFEHAADLITIKPKLNDYSALLGTYKVVNYDSKSLYWEDAEKKAAEQLDYLKEQGIIAGYTLSSADSKPALKQVTLYGFNQEKLLEKGNEARKLLHAVKTATETKHLFQRRLASDQRSGMNLKQDDGQLPDHVHYQHRNIVGESSRLSTQTRNDLANEINADRLQAAFECLACAKEVITFGAQGARTNHSYVFSPINTVILRSQSTCDWYNIFQSNIEKRYTSYGHYETTKAKPYDFAAMEKSVNDWTQSHTEKIKYKLSVIPNN